MVGPSYPIPITVNRERDVVRKSPKFPYICFWFSVGHVDRRHVLNSEYEEGNFPISNECSYVKNEKSTKI